MSKLCKYIFFLFLCAPFFLEAEIQVGIGKEEITPPIGTPSAGYSDRKGEEMIGVHDPLFAIALFIDNGEKKIALCSVDHLGFTYEMAQEVVRLVHCHPGLEECEVYIGSSHTHSGGGAYLNIPFLGEYLAGSFNPGIVSFYVEKTAQAIIEASQKTIPAKVGIGYGKCNEICHYRGSWPLEVYVPADLAVIKVTTMEDRPFALLFNYALHPTVLKSQNRLFSSDFVGYAREHLHALLGEGVQAIYFNGAQGDIVPFIRNKEDPFDACHTLGKILAEKVEEIWNHTPVQNSLEISNQKKSYTFDPQPTPFGLTLPINHYQSEMNVLIFNGTDAFVTMPGELSCLYNIQLKEVGADLGYQHVSILGLVNDAHGYFILPDSWRHKTLESALSFGGENYGEKIKEMAITLLRYQAEKRDISEMPFLLPTL